VLQTKDVEQTQLVLGMRVCSRFDSRRFALRLANAILGENMSSRLFQVVREKHGMAYSIYSSLSHYADTGLLGISAGLDAGNVSKALGLVLGELKRLSARPPGRAEFQRARDYVLGQMDLSLENTENRMNWVGEQLTGYDRVSTEAAVRRRVAQVTPTEVSRAMREYCRADRMSLALVGPMKSAASLKRMLREY
jgi:predicted Zn-dependent peptidase